MKSTLDCILLFLLWCIELDRVALVALMFKKISFGCLLQKFQLNFKLFTFHKIDFVWLEERSLYLLKKIKKVCCYFPCEIWLDNARVKRFNLFVTKNLQIVQFCLFYFYLYIYFCVLIKSLIFNCVMLFWI